MHNLTPADLPWSAVCLIPLVGALAIAAIAWRLDRWTQRRP
jgi:hypothetical protein